MGNWKIQQKETLVLETIITNFFFIYQTLGLIILLNYEKQEFANFFQKRNKTSNTIHSIFM